MGDDSALGYRFLLSSDLSPFVSHLPLCHISLWSHLPLVTSPFGRISLWSCLPLRFCPTPFGHVSSVVTSPLWSRLPLAMSPFGHISFWSRLQPLRGLVHRIKRRWRQRQRQRLPLFYRIDSFIHLIFCICRGRVRGRHGSHSSRKSSCSH